MSHTQPDGLPSCFFEAHGDVTISLFPAGSIFGKNASETRPQLIRIDAAGGVQPLNPPSCADVSNTQEIRLSSNTLTKASTFFKDSLKQEWLVKKETGVEESGPDMSQCMKSYELELDTSGCDFLIGKVILIINKNPLFADGFCFSMSYVDACLGLDVWVSAFERHLVYLGYVFKGLQNLPNRIEPFVKDVFTADEWNLVLLTWNTWLQQRAEKSRAEYQYVDSSVLALHSIAVLDVVLPFWSFKYPPVVAEKASNHLQHALILAKDRTYRHITVDRDEIFGFRINNARFLAKYGYPWLYRQEDETDDRLFGLIATNNLLDVKEDLIDIEP
ncbi:hypothetical protein D6C76_01176 [Aureobasidium pullulans]|nr:hypothetical protein D6C76_01176 [Aureobasidium pullulans]